MVKTVPASAMPGPTHHPDEALLVDYASGTFCEAGSVIMASHLTLCPACRSVFSTCERLGGDLLEAIKPEPVSKRCLAAVLARLDEDDREAPVDGPRPTADLVLPAPLRRRLGTDLRGVRWRSVMPGIEDAEVPTCPGRGKGRLLRIRPGVTVPRHTHEGLEMTLVLAGGFSDERGLYLRGDMSVSGPEIEHGPSVHGDGECLCLVVTDGPLKLTGRFARLFNPFVKF